ncbi:MAG: phosphatase [Candidatus Latescibacteria bacterium]|nr:phosphatase [Candidatus Latescibacterota bacterium]
MPIAEAFNYHRISDQIATSGQPTAAQLRHLAQEGFVAVVNLLPVESKNALPEERSIIEEQGLEYHHIPVDFDDPTEDDFHIFAHTLDQLGDKKVLIHCAANYRVSTFYALYAVHNLQWPEGEALQLIEAVWDPIAYPPWDQFIEELI